MQSGSEATISFYVKSETPVGRMCFNGKNIRYFKLGSGLSGSVLELVYNFLNKFSGGSLRPSSSDF